jgi:hypothetical protein
LSRSSTAESRELPKPSRLGPTRLAGVDPLTERIRQHFEELGEGEWSRLDDSPRGRVAFAVHRRMLEDCVRPGGVVVASVMATVGSARYFLPAIEGLIDSFGIAHVDHEIATGDLRFTPGSHTCQMYRWRELESLIATQPCRLLAVSASNCMSLANAETVARIEADPRLRAWFVDWEIRLCREPGAIDAGTHILFAVERLPTEARG